MNSEVFGEDYVRILRLLARGRRFGGVVAAVSWV